MRSIPGTITEYGIEQRLANERAARESTPTPDQFVVGYIGWDGALVLADDRAYQSQSDAQHVIDTRLTSRDGHTHHKMYKLVPVTE